MPAASSAGTDQEGAAASQTALPDASSPADAALASKAGGQDAAARKLTAPGSSSAPAAAGRTAGAGTSTISVRLVPAGTVELAADQLKPLLGCSNALLAHMFARGSYCGAATKIIASEAGEAGEEGAEGAAGDEGSPDGHKASAGAQPWAGDTKAPGTPPAAAAPSSPPAEPAATASPEGVKPAAAAEQQPGEQQPEPMQVDSGSAGAQGDGHTLPTEPGAATSAEPAAAGAAAAPVSEEDADVAAAAQQLVQRALHRVLLLHDKKGLPRRKRTRAEDQAAELASCAAAADEAGFLLAPLLVEGGQAGTQVGGTGSASPASSSGSEGGSSSAAATTLDWAAVREIAAVAAFEGNLLEWLSQQEEGQPQGQQAAEEASAFKVPCTAAEGSGGMVCRPSASGALNSKQAAALSGRVLVTTYNGQSYLHRWAGGGCSGSTGSHARARAGWLNQGPIGHRKTCAELGFWPHTWPCRGMAQGLTIESTFVRRWVGVRLAGLGGWR